MAAPTFLNEERMKAYSAAAKETFTRLKKLLDLKQQELLEYDSLIKKLKELPRRRTQPIMCPIGSVGFLSANIVHTNEVLVGLGDGYFVDTTCYDAVEILKRRRKVVEKGVADLHEHEKLLENYSKYAKELFENEKNSDEVEIREEYDEEKEAELRRKRKTRKAEPHPITKTIADINAETELMRRLEELEQQELRNGELENSFDEAIEFEDDEPPPTLEKILEKLDDDDTECLMSILSPDKLGGSCGKDQQALYDKPTTSTTELVGKEEENANERSASEEVAAGVKEQGTSDNFSLSESDASKLRFSEIIDLPLKRKDDLMRMLAEQEQEYEENIQAYQPPPGISTEAYQRILRTVEEMNDDDDDENSEEDEDENGRILKERNLNGATGTAAVRNDEGSDLDSDDLLEPDLNPDNQTAVGPFTVQNLGPTAPFNSMGSDRGVEGRCDKKNVSVSGVEENNVLSTEGNKKTKPKKKKSVVFATKLENATVIDKNAPPSDVRTETSTSSSKTNTTSILRNAGEETPTDSKLLAEMSAKEGKHKVVLPGSKEAFTGVIQERNVEVLESGDVALGPSEESAKPKSLFKMARLKNHV